MTRLSIITTLAVAIGFLALTLLALIADGAWDAWRRTAVTRTIVTATEVTDHMFAALHNLRVDRSSTSRDLRAEDRKSTRLNSSH